MLHQRLPLLPPTPKKQQQKTNKLQAQKQVSKMSQQSQQFLCVTDVGDVFALHVLHSKYPKNERNKTRLTLAPNRGILGVFWTYSGSVVVLSWDLTHKNTQTSTQVHACRVTLTLARSGDTNTRGSPRRSAYKTYAFEQTHKFDKKIPVILAKTATAALPFLY